MLETLSEYQYSYNNYIKVKKFGISIVFFVFLLFSIVLKQQNNERRITSQPHKIDIIFRCEWKVHPEYSSFTKFQVRITKESRVMQFLKFLLFSIVFSHYDVIKAKQNIFGLQIFACKSILSSCLIPESFILIANVGHGY